MWKCDFNKVALQFYLNHTSAWVFSCNLRDIFRTSFLRNTFGEFLLKIAASVMFQTEEFLFCIVSIFSRSENYQKKGLSTISI